MPDDLPPDHVIAKALTHPLRAQALAMLAKQSASPKELARELDVSLPHLSYHVRALADLGVIRLERTAQRRGVIEHYYGATVRAYVVAKRV
jgi:DNA-binding transcriptional ArsR family regulator